MISNSEPFSFGLKQAQGKLSDSEVRRLKLNKKIVETEINIFYALAAKPGQVLTEADYPSSFYLIPVEWYTKWMAYPRILEEAINNRKEVEELPLIDSNTILVIGEDRYMSLDDNDRFNYIVKPEISIQEALTLKKSYIRVNEKQWILLNAKYQGKPILRKQYIDEDLPYVVDDIDFLRVKLQVVSNTKPGVEPEVTKAKIFYCSKYETLHEFRQRLLKVLNGALYNFNLQNFRLWKIRPLSNPYHDPEGISNIIDKSLVEEEVKDYEEEFKYNAGIECNGSCLDFYDPRLILKKLDIKANTTLVVEKPNGKGEYYYMYNSNVKKGLCSNCSHDEYLMFPCLCEGVSYCSIACKIEYKETHREQCPILDRYRSVTVPAEKASYNLGKSIIKNTGSFSFMPNLLQCLSNTWQLAEYFLTNRHTKDLTPEYFLELKDGLTRGFIKLLKRLWHGRAIMGIVHLDQLDDHYNQRYPDCKISQVKSNLEFTSNFLKALHEDLNRSKDKDETTNKKPQAIEYADESVDLEEIWKNYLLKNDSIIADLFHGQHKAISRCSGCNNGTYTIEPFTTISLPIEPFNEIKLIVSYVPYDIREPIKELVIPMLLDDEVYELRRKISSELKVYLYNSVLAIVEPLFMNGVNWHHGSCDLIKVLPLCESIREVYQLLQKGYCLLAQEIDPNCFDIKNQMLKHDEEEEFYTAGKRKTGAESKVRPFQFDEGKLRKEDYDIIFNDEVVMIPVNFRKLHKITDGAGIDEEVEAITRFLHVKKSDTFEDVHMRIYRFLRPLLDEHINGKIEYKQADDRFIYSSLLAQSSKTEAGIRFEKLPYELFFVLTKIKIDPQENITECHHKSLCSCVNRHMGFIDFVRVSDVLNDLNILRNNSFYFEGYRSRGLRVLEIAVEFTSEAKPFHNKNLLNFMLKKTIINKPIKQDIYDCFELFDTLRQIKPVDPLDDSSQCKHCTYTYTKKEKLEITHLPPILILHLNRFMFRGKTYDSKKSDRFIDFPLTDLDLTKYVKTKESVPKYDLHAVCNHYGESETGVYETFAWNKEYKKWFCLNDTKVTEIGRNDVRTRSAYILFYTRKDIVNEIDYKTLRKEAYKANRIPPVKTPTKEEIKAEMDKAKAEAEFREAVRAKRKSEEQAKSNAFDTMSIPSNFSVMKHFHGSTINFPLTRNIHSLENDEMSPRQLKLIEEMHIAEKAAIKVPPELAWPDPNIPPRKNSAAKDYFNSDAYVEYRWTSDWNLKPVRKNKPPNESEEQSKEGEDKPEGQPINMFTIIANERAAKKVSNESPIKYNPFARNN